MSESYEVLVLIPEQLPVKEVVYKTHQIISEMGGFIDEDCMLILNDTKDVSPDIEYIYDDAVALDKLANWPVLGGINYAMPDAIITVEYAGEFAAFTVQAIRITIPDTIFFDENGLQSKDRYANLASTLHQSLRAKRTIVDWGLMYMGVYWKEEIERLNNGEYLGSYFVDLRAEDASKQGLVAPVLHSHSYGKEAVTFLAIWAAILGCNPLSQSRTVSRPSSSSQSYLK